jgi:hypothetical protein
MIPASHLTLEGISSNQLGPTTVKFFFLLEIVSHTKHIFIFSSEQVVQAQK